METITNQVSDTVRKMAKKYTSSSALEHGKLPPQAVDLEEAVLGALMLEKNALSAVVDILKAECFYKDSHQKIYTAITQLFQKSEPIDILTVTNQLKRNGQLDMAGGAYYIQQLTNRIASSANVEYHARIILQKHIQRELIRISSEIIKDAYEDTTDVFELLNKAESNIFKVAEGNIRKNYDTMSEIIKESIVQIEKAALQKDGISGVQSGFKDLDKLTAGWQKSDLIILAARPGMGKTAFVLSLARNTAIDFHKPVALFSLEMSSIQLVNRLISSETQLPQDKLKKGHLEKYEWEQLHAKIPKLAEAPIFIDDTPALSIFELRAKCRRLKQQHDIQLVIIDYLQLMTASTGDGRGNREQEISTISRSLKSIAKELEVPIIALSQLSRAVETRGGDKRPQLSDLRESGAIEQDADMVMFIYRPEYYGITQAEDGTPLNGIGQLIVAKHRNGGLEDINLRFVSNLAKFENLENDDMGGGNSYGSRMTPASDFDQPSGNSGGSYTMPSRMNDMDDEVAPF
jgi:replicative DNA helicase